MNDEVSLLIEKNIGTIVRYGQSKSNDKEFEKNLLKEQQLVYKHNRKRQLEEMFEEIVSSKRKKGDVRDNSEIFDDELNKSSQISSDKMIWPINVTPASAVIGKNS